MRRSRQPTTETRSSGSCNVCRRRNGGIIGCSTDWHRIGRHSTSLTTGKPHTAGRNDVRSWNVIGGVGSVAIGLYLIAFDLPAALWWAPWSAFAGGALLLA